MSSFSWDVEITHVYFSAVKNIQMKDQSASYIEYIHVPNPPQKKSLAIHELM
jgi:hypothetical protein